jgi:hypothetical protein
LTVFENRVLKTIFGRKGEKKWEIDESSKMKILLG